MSARAPPDLEREENERPQQVRRASKSAGSLAALVAGQQEAAAGELSASVKSAAKEEAQSEGVKDEDKSARKMNPNSRSERSRAPPEESSQARQSKQLAASLRAAANEGKVELVRLLIRCGADVNAQDDEFGNTALHQAAWNGFSETIQVLCKHRASALIKNKANFSPLHLACQQGHNQSARLLLMAGARADMKNSYGDTALHTAARYGHAGVARILLSAKCNPNPVNKNNDTPLHIAVAMGRRKLTRIFMQNGAEPSIKNQQGETPMDIALRKDLIEIQELIANPPAPSSGPLKSGARHKSASHLDQWLTGPQVSEATSQNQLLCSQLYSSSRVPAQFPHDQPHTRHAHHHHHSNHRHAHHGHGHRRHHRRRRGEHLRAGSQDFRHRLLIDELDDLDDLDDVVDLCGGADRPSSRRRGRSSAEPARHRQTTPIDAEPAEVRRRRRSSAAPVRCFASENALNVPPLGGVSRGRAELGVDVGPTEAPQEPKYSRTRTLVAGIEGLELSRNERAADDPEAAFRAHGTRPMQNLKGGDKLARDDERDSDQAAKVERADQVKPLPTRTSGRPASPTTSVRSSQVSRARGRLTVRPRRLAVKDKRLALGGVNLGTCVGKLSLLQLRNLVNRRAAQRRREQETFEVESSREGKELGAEGGADKRPAALLGRRAERLGRQVAGESAPADGSGRCLMRAPNGTKLLNARPLAPLDDDTQLYAIPRKNLHSKAAEGQQQVASAAGDQKSAESPKTAADARRLANDGAARQEAPDSLQQQSPDGTTTIKTAKTSAARIAEASAELVGSDAAEAREEKRHQKQQSAGPALTSSDSGNSLACANNSAPSSPGNNLVANSAVAAAYDDRDFCAPGYSIVVRGAGRKQASAAAPEACLCPKGPAAGQPSEGERQLSDWLRMTSSAAKAGEREGLLTKADRSASESPERELIRPKSALGGASAELIAAQRTLAAAAAAKVHRDRLAKMVAADNCRLLTVKTGADDDDDGQEPAYWPARGLTSAVAPAGGGGKAGEAACNPQLIKATSGGQMVVARAAAAECLLHHRSGTNSVGMSDSSPSNNGADSDNSLQTSSTTSNTVLSSAGSMSTINGQEAQKSASAAAPTITTAATSASKVTKSPFGILSRILSNNSNNGSGKLAKANGKRQQAAAYGKSQTAVAAQQLVADADGKRAPARAPQTQFNGSISSSSAMSSPSISAAANSASQASPLERNSSADTAPPNGDEGAAARSHAIDRLGSRSRRPIVLSQSNELAAGENLAPAGAASKPRGVLKDGASAWRHEATQAEARHLEASALVNGLPRVASYTTLSAKQQQNEASLCDYHALFKSHMIQAKYSPYLPYQLGRYSIHETCDPSAGSSLAAYAHHNGYHRSASNLNGLMQAYNPTSASAYGLSGAPRDRHHDTTLISDNASMVCNYSHEDSAIYIQPYLTEHQQQPFYGVQHQPQHNHQLVGENLAHEHWKHNGHQQQPTNGRYNDFCARQRPKSSLDSILLSDCQPTTTATGQSGDNNAKITYGQRLASANDDESRQQVKCNGQPTELKARPAGGQQHPLLAPSGKAHLNIVQQHNGHHDHDNANQYEASQHQFHHFNVTQNSIYASDHLHQHLKSELKVLPTSPTDTSAAVAMIAKSGQQQRSPSTESLKQPLETLGNGPMRRLNHKSLVQVNVSPHPVQSVAKLQSQLYDNIREEDEELAKMEDNSLAARSPPKTNGNTKTTTRVSIGCDWTRSELDDEKVIILNGSAIRTNSTTNAKTKNQDENFDDFSGATVL